MSVAKKNKRLPTRKPRVAIVCDWLLGIGGAERVVLELHKMFPDAPIYTSQYNPKAIDWFKDATVRTTWLQGLPKGLKKFLPILRAWTFPQLDLTQYDIVISSSGAEAKAIRTRADALYICYCHAPTHYYWNRYDDYVDRPGFGVLDPLARWGLRLLVKPMRRWDYKAAQRPDVIVTNSHYSQRMIKKYYHRESTVIFPPVEQKRFTPTKNTAARKGFVVAGRQTPYKRIDLAVAACSHLGVPLTVIGNGPDHQKLRQLAGSNIRFLTNVSDSEMPKHFQGAEGFIFPGLDDFGIVAVEALAAGTPVVAYKGGGALEYIEDGRTGLFFDKQSVEALAEALNIFAALRFSSKNTIQKAQQFNPRRFRVAFKRMLAATAKKSNK